MFIDNFFISPTDRSWSALSISKNGCSSLQYSVTEVEHEEDAAAPFAYLHRNWNKYTVSKEGFLQCPVRFFVFRDPVERFVSAFRTVKQHRMHTLEFDEAFFARILDSVDFRAIDEHFRPMQRCLDDVNLDDFTHVVRLRDLNTFFADILNKPLWSKNVSRSKPTELFEHGEAIRRLYRRDFDLEKEIEERNLFYSPRRVATPQAKGTKRLLLPFARCISLARRPERRKAFLKRLDHAGISGVKIVDAVDGASMAIPHLFQRMPGAIGCRESHLNIYRELLQSKHEYAIIFEDDAEFRVPLEEINATIKNIPTGWNYFAFDPKVTEARFVRVAAEGIIETSWTQCTAAYCISRGFAKMLIDEVNLHRWPCSPNAHIDQLIANVMRRNGLPIYCSKETLITCPKDIQSDVEWLNPGRLESELLSKPLIVLSAPESGATLLLKHLNSRDDTIIAGEVAHLTDRIADMAFSLIPRIDPVRQAECGWSRLRCSLGKIDENERAFDQWSPVRHENLDIQSLRRFAYSVCTGQDAVFGPTTWGWVDCVFGSNDCDRNSSFRKIDAIRFFFPNARFVFLYRDPKETAGIIQESHRNWVFHQRRGEIRHTLASIETQQAILRRIADAEIPFALLRSAPENAIGKLIQ